MNPLARLKRFAKAAPVLPKKKETDTFTYKGVTYATPSSATEAIPGFFISTRGKAWSAYCSSRA